MKSINISKISKIINNLQIEQNWNVITFKEMDNIRNKIMTNIMSRTYNSFILNQFEKLEGQKDYNFQNIEYKIGDKIFVHFMDTKPCIITDFKIRLNFVTWNIDVDIEATTNYNNGNNDKVYSINHENTKISKRI
ncbi:hypothetical protein [Clostridium tagluense]|uniref:Uncharacterized protein n=1 Tax=Clostridium tagluense TaxID=360422 RepID=A0A401USY2_9CLOT|nr:hypothetical protein [Clostridium tagluense]GCD12616.1 hypothetical protein Ctaglu_42390 [Clostridium tagluense]